MLSVTIEAVKDVKLLDNNTLQVGENIPAGEVFANLVVSFPVEDLDIATELLLGEENVSIGSTSCTNVKK